MKKRLFFTITPLILLLITIAATPIQLYDWKLPGFSWGENVIGQGGEVKGEVLSHTGTPHWSLFRDTADSDKLKVYFNAIGQTAMTVTTGGNVGIGMTNPQSKLDIIGDINLSGKITNGGAKVYFVASDTRTWVSGIGWNVVAYNRVASGNSGNWYNPANGYFTAPVAGVYICTSNNYITSSVANATFIHHNIACNGAWDQCNGAVNYTINGLGNATVKINDTPGSYYTNYDHSTSTTRIAYLNIGDYIYTTVYIYDTANTPRYYMYGADSTFSCSLIN